MRREGRRRRIRELEEGLAAATWLLGKLLPQGERVEQLLGVLDRGLADGEISREGCAALIRQWRAAGWRFSPEVDVEGWTADLLRRIERGEEPVS